jgi:hypothetical protein
LLKQTLSVANAGLARVDLQIGKAAGSPYFLAVIVVETAKGRFVIPAGLAVDLPGTVQLVIVTRNVVDGFFELIHSVTVTGIEEADQPLYFGKCLFPQLTDSLARFLRSLLLSSQLARSLAGNELWQLYESF